MHEQTVKTFIAVAISALLLSSVGTASAQAIPNIGTSAPLQTDSSGSMGRIAMQSVLRVVCSEKGVLGTGFIHKSGNVITAAHVVVGCSSLVIFLPNGAKIPAKIINIDETVDLALIKPSAHIDAPPLVISNTANLPVGSLISLWGFPAGYNGIPAMLSVGYLSGVDAVQTQPGKIVGQWVLNAAVNHGNSGGPVILVETGEVIGVADNKIAPLSDIAISALTALQKQGSGFVYPATMADGTQHNFSEGQVVAMVLEELRQQVQLVIGHAVFLGDLRIFLTKSGIEP